MRKCGHTTSASPSEERVVGVCGTTKGSCCMCVRVLLLLLHCVHVVAGMRHLLLLLLLLLWNGDIIFICCIWCIST